MGNRECQSSDSEVDDESMDDTMRQTEDPVPSLRKRDVLLLPIVIVAIGTVLLLVVAGLCGWAYKQEQDNAALIDNAPLTPTIERLPDGCWNGHWDLWLLGQIFGNFAAIGLMLLMLLVFAILSCHPSRRTAVDDDCIEGSFGTLGVLYGVWLFGWSIYGIILLLSYPRHDHKTFSYVLAIMLVIVEGLYGTVSCVIIWNALED